MANENHQTGTLIFLRGVEISSSEGVFVFFLYIKIMNIRLTAFRNKNALNDDIPHMEFLELLEYKAYLEI